VAEALRDARNFELSDRYSEALSVYRKIANLDSRTDGLDQLVARANQKRSEQLLKKDIGFGMSALASGNLDEAEKYFASGRLLSPENETVLAGLRYKNQLEESVSLAELRKAASSAITSEEWDEAIRLYKAVLDSHPFATFAIEGIRDTLKLQESTDQLEIIVSQPEKLSDEKLFAQATDVFRSAARLLDTMDEERLTNFRSLTTQVKGLLNRYSSPISVTLYSDDATEIFISGVGSLGQFQQTIIQLNVGEQTFKGIQNGCTDVYRTVIVEPGMRPIDIRCEERISR
jgi:tetratricopeptide (TPR) repeat protein